MLATVVGSGITGERLSGGKVAIPLLANTMATGAMPVALILTFRPIGVRLIPRLLSAVDQLRQSGLPQLVQLGQTLESWKEEIATIWRFTRNNGITEGFHNKMETISRKAYGFRNFENYRLRVKTFCS